MDELQAPISLVILLATLPRTIRGLATVRYQHETAELTILEVLVTRMHTKERIAITTCKAMLMDLIRHVRVPDLDVMVKAILNWHHETAHGHALI